MTSGTRDAFIGVDVGTGSARAGVFDGTGTLLATARRDITTWREEGGIAEQSSEEIWRAVAASVREAVSSTELPARTVKGIGFDATCSLVVLDRQGHPLPVGPSGEARRNIVVWMDHRASGQAERINATGHEVLRYVGGRISPEMETPKLLWLKENMPSTFRAAGNFFDLADFLSWRATGSRTRSMCTVVCKWTYLGHERRWDAGYFHRIGLGELADEGFERIGSEILDIAAPVGAGLSEAAADELGLLPGTPVGTSLIDAHAGGVGTLGGRLPSGEASDPLSQVAAIMGTSCCTMTVTRDPVFVPGVWGPYSGAMVPGYWLNEGGQSAFGAAIDHLVKMHPASAEASEKAAQKDIALPAFLETLACQSAGSIEGAIEAAKHIHVVPEFLGNRAPEADPDATAVISGLRLEEGIGDLANLYVAGLCGLAYGLGQILDAQREQGVDSDTLVLSGGMARSRLMQRIAADATGLSVAMPETEEPVLLGAAMLGAVACGKYADLVAAGAAMSRFRDVVVPAGGESAELHAAKRRAYAALQRCEREVRRMTG